MTIRAAIEMALDSILAHKLRSFLTLLGIIIAVTTLIGVVSVIAGMNSLIADRVANLGSNVFTLTRFGIITSIEEWMHARKRRRLTMEDYEALATSLRLARAVGATSWSSADCRAGDAILYEVSLRGVTANMIEIGTEQVGSGRYVSEPEVAHRAPVCFIGADVADGLFAGRDPLGRTLRIVGVPFRVIGVARREGSVLGESQDNFIHIPLSTFLKLFGRGWTSLSIHVLAARADLYEAAQDEARMLMRARHHLRYAQSDDFGLVTSEAIYKLWKNLSGVVAAVAVGITAIFMVVGGIVVMNIMLASVLERTQEIGIRKSLGARWRDILLQFVVESIVLTTAGGLLGVLLAVGLTRLLAAFTPIPFRMPFSTVVLGVGLAGTVGLVSGLYPARRAAMLDPIEAIRAE